MNSKKIKIAVIGTRGIPATSGGIEKHCEELYPLLVKKGYEVTVYCRNYYVKNNNKGYKGVNLKIVPVINIKGFETFIYAFLSTIHAIFSDADIIHYHAQGPTIFSWIPRFLTPNKKIVFTCHGIDWQRDKWSFIAKMLIKLGEKASALCSHSRIMVSQSLADHYQKIYNVTSSKIVNGVTLKDRIPLNKLCEKFDIKEKDYFLFVGRLVPEKAPDSIIKAFKNINTDKKLLIVGGSASTNDYCKYLKSLAKDDNRIIFTDYLYGDELQEVYSNAYAYVTASKLEGLPITVLEAMSNSIPVIMSEIPPHEEIKSIDEENFVSFIVNNVNDCRKAMEQTLLKSDNEITVIGNGMKNLVKQYFSWEMVADETHKVYEQVLETYNVLDPVSLKN